MPQTSIIVVEIQNAVIANPSSTKHTPSLITQSVETDFPVATTSHLTKPAHAVHFFFWLFSSISFKILHKSGNVWVQNKLQTPPLIDLKSDADLDDKTSVEPLSSIGLKTRSHHTTRAQQKTNMLTNKTTTQSK